MAKFLCIILSFFSSQLYAAAPSTVDAPVSGSGWRYNQHNPGGSYAGIGGANDGYSWDVNFGTGDDDDGLPVYAVESGDIYTGNGWGGDSFGQLLINHTTSTGQWSTGYLHMKNIVKKAGFVKKGEKIGEISRVGYLVNSAITSEHLHFAVYGTHGKRGLKSVDVLIDEVDIDGGPAETLGPIVNLILDYSRSTPRSDSINIEDLPSLPYTDENGVTYTDRIVFQSSAEISSKKANGATYLTSASEQWVVCPGTYGPAGITVYSAFSSRRNFIRNPNTGEWARDTTSPAFRSPFLEVDYTVPLYDLTFDVIFNGIFAGTIPSEPKPPCVLPTKTVVFGAVLFDQSDVER